jgi:large subunit ribosomal protein L10e
MQGSTDKKEFEYTLEVLSKSTLQIRDNALEAARQTSNRVLEARIGKSNFKYKIMVYPHHILRENPLAAGAGADRMSTGMKFSFGKPIGIAAQIKKGKTLFLLKVNKEHLEPAREALRKASSKLPCSTSLKVTHNKPLKKAKTEKEVPKAEPKSEVEKPAEKVAAE